MEHLDRNTLMTAYWMRERPRGTSYHPRGHLFVDGSDSAICRRAGRPEQGKRFSTEDQYEIDPVDPAYRHWLSSKCALCDRVFTTARVSAEYQSTDLVLGVDGPVTVEDVLSERDADTWIGFVITRVHGADPNGVQHLDIDPGYSTSLQQLQKLVYPFTRTATHVQFHPAGAPFATAH